MSIAKKTISLFLSLLIVLSIISVAFGSIKIQAETFPGVSEYPDFDMDCYVADLFITEEKKTIEIEMNSDSTNKVMKNGIENNSGLMNSMKAWKAATFEASDVTNDTVTELGYYETIILSALNSTMNSTMVKDAFDNAVIKDGKMMFDSFKDILKSEYFITDFSLETYNSLSSEQQNAYINSFEAAFKKQYPKLDKTGNALKIFNTVVKTAKSFEECINNFAGYAMCRLINEHLSKVIKDLYNKCPSSNATLKAALLNISNACTSAELEIGSDALDAIYRGSNVIFGVLTDGWVSSIISAHPAGLALMLGRAVGKSVSNILFSTDAICENYYKICCFDEFEKLVRSVTEFEMDTYKDNKTNENANNMFWAVRLMFSINEGSCDLSIDYAKTIYENSVAGIFLDKTKYENFKTTVNNIRQYKQENYSNLMTSYVFYLEEDYPDIYAAYMRLNDQIENPVIHVSGINFSKKHMTLGLEDDIWYFWNNAEVTPSNASNKAVNYTSSDNSIVSIVPGNTLQIKLHKTGNAVITATSVDGGYTDTLSIDVVDGHGEDGIHLKDPSDNIVASGNCGSKVYYKLYNDGTLKIYGSGKMLDYRHYDYRFYNHFSELDSIKYVIIENGVTNIGAKAFSGCGSLTSVNIPDSVTSIGDFAFYECTNLTSISIPDSVTSIETAAFRDCDSLVSATIPDSVTSIGVSTFSGCKNLVSVTIPNSVTSIGASTFSYCSSLTNISIPDSVTSIEENAFLYCERLMSINIPDSVTSIGESTFSYCSSLTNISIPDSVTSIEKNAFQACTSLTSVNIGNSVRSIGEWAFSGCKSLTNVSIKDIVAWCNIDFGSNPLSYAKKLYLNGELVTNLVIPDSVTSIGESAFNDCESLVSVTIPNSVTSIGESAFGDCKSLVSINIPDSVTSIGASTFSYCSSLTNISIPDSVTSIGNSAFVGCKSLLSVIIPDNVKKIGSCAFYCCNQLEHVSIPYSVTDIGDSVFEYTKWFESLSDEYVVINKHLIKCNRYNNIKLPEGIVKICGGVFCGISPNVENVILPDGLKTIGLGAFSGCNSIKSIIIPDSVNRISASAFYNCYNLKNVVITSKELEIDSDAFFGCDELKTIELPKNTELIGRDQLGYTWNSKKIDGFTIYGTKGTAAEKYAKDNGFIFKEKQEDSKTTKAQTTVPIVTNDNKKNNTKITAKPNAKKSNTLTVKAKAKTIKLKKLKKKNQTVKPLTVKKAKGKVTYKIIKNGTTKKIRKYVKISKKGAITFKKWKKAKKGTYKVKVTVTAAGNKSYKKGSKTVTAKIKVK